MKNIKKCNKYKWNVINKYEYRESINRNKTVKLIYKSKTIKNVIQGSELKISRKKYQCISLFLKEDKLKCK